MAFGIGDSLSVRISAQTGDFERGVDAAERSLSALVDNTLAASSALEFLSNRADDAKDNVDQLGRAASTTSGTLGTLTGASALTSTSFGGLSGTTLAVLIPALVALSTTLVPLAATLTGLATAGLAVAGAFGAIVGSGLLAFGEKRAEQNTKELEQVNARIRALERLEDTEEGLTDTQREQLETLEERQDKLEDSVKAGGALEKAFADLQAQLVPIIADFGQQFIPLIEDAINAIPSLARSILNAIGPLDSFLSALRGFGRVAQRELPNLVSRLATLARNSLPAVISAGQWLIQNGPSIFEGILQTTRQVTPLLSQLGSAFVDALPAINRFGIAVLNTLIPALSRGTRGFGDLLNQILQFVQSDRFTAILTEVRNLIQEIGPEVGVLIDRFGNLFDTVIENLPSIIRGLTAVADAVLDIAIFASNFAIPALETVIEIISFLADAFANFSEESGSLGTINQTDVVADPGSQNPFADANRGQTNVNVTVQGDRDLVKNASAEVIEERERRANRNTGGNTTP